MRGNCSGQSKSLSLSHAHTLSLSLTCTHTRTRTHLVLIRWTSFLLASNGQRAWVDSWLVKFSFGQLKKAALIPSYLSSRFESKEGGGGDTLVQIFPFSPETRSHQVDLDFRLNLDRTEAFLRFFFSHVHIPQKFTISRNPERLIVRVKSLEWVVQCDTLAQKLGGWKNWLLPKF